MKTAMDNCALGATPSDDGTRFRAWTTTSSRVDVRLFRDARTAERTLPLEPRGSGLFEAALREAGRGTLYKLVLDGDEVSDPYARFLPFGVHGPAEVIAMGQADLTFRPALKEHLVLYELHVGTFTPEGTYAAASRRLDDLADLGVNAVELLPLSSFPGVAGWGYDGVAHFAPHAPYGRPEELRSFVEQAHARGIAVLLDVVYNHLGPRGNYLPRFSPSYLSPASGPWGGSPDFTNARMRAYVLESARHWFDDYGFDGLRLDATHAIRDPSPRHILKELHELAVTYDPPRLLIAEDDRNDPTLATAKKLDAIWADDFHHQVHTLLTGERDGYYGAYEPTVAALAHTIEHGWEYEGQVYAPWQKPRGQRADRLPPSSFVYCIQNHDQVGNRALGTRLEALVDIQAFRAATALLLFLPMTPLLFMGQEWAAFTPFLYFTDHDQDFGHLVSKGRREEFRSFSAFATPEACAAIPDPQSPETFARSKLRWEERDREPHRSTLTFVRDAIALRQHDAVLGARCGRSDLIARAEGDVLVVERRALDRSRKLVVNFSSDPLPIPAEPAGRPILATQPWSKTLPPRSAYVLA